MPNLQHPQSPNRPSTLGPQYLRTPSQDSGLSSLYSTPHHTTTTTTLLHLSSSFLIDNTQQQQLVINLHRQHPHPKPAVVIPSLPQCKQALPPRTSGRVGNKGHQQTALQGPQLSTMHDGVAPPREASQRYRPYILSSMIGDLEHPVGRHGQVREWGNTATSTRAVNRAPIWACGHFLGDPCTSRLRSP